MRSDLEQWLPRLYERFFGTPGPKCKIIIASGMPRSLAGFGRLVIALSDQSNRFTECAAVTHEYLSWAQKQSGAKSAETWNLDLRAVIGGALLLSRAYDERIGKGYLLWYRPVEPGTRLIEILENSSLYRIEKARTILTSLWPEQGQHLLELSDSEITEIANGKVLTNEVFEQSAGPVMKDLLQLFGL